MVGQRVVAQVRLWVAVILAVLLLLSLTSFSSIARGASPNASGAFDGSAGHTTLNRAGARHTTLIVSGAKADSTFRLRFRTNSPATGKGQAMVVVVRSTPDRPSYRMRVMLLPTGQVQLAVVGVVNGTARQIAGPLVVGGLTWAPGQEMAARFAVSGEASHRLSVAVWPATGDEPPNPQLEAADQPALGNGVSFRLRFAIPRSATNAPVRFDYRAVAVAASTADEPDVPETPSFPPNSLFVAPTGNDGNPGTLEQPWRTVQRAADLAAPGATVYLRAGTYNAFQMRRSGSATAPIRFTSYPSEVATLDGRSAVEYTVRLTGVRYVELSNLVVTGGFAERHNGGGIAVEGSTQVVVRDNVVRDNKAFGIRSQNSTYVTIEGNEVTANAVGIHVGNAGAGTVVADNDIHDNTRMMVNTADIRGDDVGAGGVALVKTTGHVVVRENRVWGNRAPSFDYGYDGSAFEIYAAQNWEFTENTAWDNRVVFETGTDSARTPCSGGRFTRNVAYGPATVDVARGMVLRCAEGALIANNTFVGMQDFVFTLQHRVGTYGGSIEGLRIVNNVLSNSTAKAYSIDSAIPESVVFDANLIDHNGAGYMASMVGNGSTRSLDTFRIWTGQEQHGVAADPLFVDRAGRDFRLRFDSPGIDSALVIDGLTDSYAGDGPDRGSYEASPD